MNEKSYWLGFSCFPGIGPKKFQLLLDAFGTAQKAWEAAGETLIPVLGKALTPKFLEFREKFSLKEYELALEKNKVDFFTLHDEGYPELLKEIVDAPFVLYVKGNREVLDFARTINPTIAIVGTRRITAYGREVTTGITEQLVAAGYTIVSGLAFGVDSVAHKTCLDNGGKTIAVLGCGVDCCYPSSNKKLYEEIIEKGGAIVSESPLSMQPSLGSFPSRNRIIAGLSQAVIVTEGASDSGALYTAEDAFAVGRKVFAVPGPITSSLSKGPNALIKKGASMVTGAEEILSELGSKNQFGRLSTGQESRIKDHITGDTDEEQKVIDLLQNESLHFDELVKKTGMNSQGVGSLLSMMELKGFIKSVGDGIFSLG